MADGGRPSRRRVRVPRRPRMGHRRPVRSRPRRTGQVVCHLRWLRRRRGRLRRRLLRGVAHRGARDGPAAAVVARTVVGGARTRRHRSERPSGQRDGRVRRRHRGRLRHVGRRHRGVPADRHDLVGHVGPRRVRARARRPGGVRGHRMFVVAGGATHGGAGAAARRMRPGVGRRRDRERHPDDLRGVRQASRAGARRAVQALCRCGRRRRLGRGRRRARRRAAVGRAAARPPGAGGGAGLRGQPGRRVERADGPQRSFAAARRARGAGQRGRDRRAGRRRRGPRHRNSAGRSDRGAGAAGHLRPGSDDAAVARFGEVEHGPHAGRGRAWRA